MSFLLILYDTFPEIFFIEHSPSSNYLLQSLPQNENENCSCKKHYFALISHETQKKSVRKGVLKNFAKFKGKHVCKSLLFNKVASLSPATFIKNRLWHWSFPVNFAKLLRSHCFIE